LICPISWPWYTKMVPPSEQWNMDSSLAHLARSSGWSDVIRETVRAWSWFSTLTTGEHLGWPSVKLGLLVAVPAAVLLHLDLPRGEDLLEVGELPLLALEPVSIPRSAVEPLAARRERGAIPPTRQRENILVEVEDHLQLLVAGDRVGSVMRDRFVSGGLADRKAVIFLNLHQPRSGTIDPTDPLAKSHSR
jgi:hypothetical protein